MEQIVPVNLKDGFNQSILNAVTLLAGNVLLSCMERIQKSGMGQEWDDGTREKILSDHSEMSWRTSGRWRNVER